MPSMSCEHVAELLPWLLNGTLGEEERRTVEGHLEGCPRCRRELEDTAFAGRVFRQHLPTEVLVDYGFGRTSESLDVTVVEEHLAHCPKCAAELELVRESRRLEQEEDEGPREASVLPFDSQTPTRTRASPGSVWWRRAALAAGFAGLVVGSGWWWNALQHAAQRSAWEEREAELGTRIEKRSGDLERQLAEAREERARLAEDLERKTREGDRLRERVAALEAPRLNVWVTDVAPAETVLRGEEEPAVLSVPAGAETLTLLLQPPASLPAPTPGAAGYELELVDSAGERRWSEEGLRLQPEGDFTVSLRLDTLPPRFTLRLLSSGDGESRELARYPIVLRERP